VIDDCDELTNSFVAPQNRTVGGDKAMTNAISQNVLEEILKAYAAWEQPPSPQAIHELAAAAKSEQELIKEYSQVYRSANGEGDPWEPPHIL